MLFFLSALLCWAALVMAQGWPGPRSVSGQTYSARQTENGRKDYEYYVRDYGVLRPKLVYNCALVPALCKNARNYLGGTTGQFHYDAFRTPAKRDGAGKKKPSRVDARRGQACPSSWIEFHKCPEDDQPDWTWQSASGQMQPFVKAELYRYKDGTTHKNRLAKVEEVQVMDDSTPTGLRTEYKSTPYGAVLSCDEFPAASWIEGGAGAKTYCSPWASPCDEVDLVDEVLSGTATEQNWQGMGHNAIQEWFQHLSGSKWNPTAAKPGYTIFKFDFEASTNQPASVGDAVWIEVRGTKRICFGPRKTTGSGCQKVHADDPEPDNSQFP